MRSRLHRERIGATLLLSLGLLLTLTVVIGAPRLDRMYSGRQSRLDRIPGEIVDVQETGGSDSDAGTAWVAYDLDHDQQFADVDVGDTDDWHDGERVAVLVDPHDHSFVTLPGENYLPGWFGLWWIVLGAGRFAVVIGATALRRLPKVKRALAAGPWRSVVGRRIRAGAGDNALHLLFLPSVGGGSFWRLLRRPGKGSEFHVDVAGTDDRELVVRPARIAADALGPIRQDGRVCRGPCHRRCAPFATRSRYGSTRCHARTCTSSRMPTSRPGSTTAISTEGPWSPSGTDPVARSPR